MNCKHEVGLGKNRNVVFWVAIILIIIVYSFTYQPKPGIAEKEKLARRFKFDQFVIEVDSFTTRSLIYSRQVHPSLKRIQSWISATGAAITLADLDRDGLYNDMLLVDPRLNTILVKPVPSTGDRYPAFTLDPKSLNYNTESMSPTGSLVGDFNEDGLNDILVHYWGRTPLVFFQTRTSESQQMKIPAAENFQPTELIPVGPKGPERWFTHAATQADIDGDGHLDLLIGNFFQDNSDILNKNGTGTSAVMQAGKSNARNGGGAKLFLWTAIDSRRSPNEIFRDVSVSIEKHCGKGWVLALGAVDLDPNSMKWRGLPEIYIANDFGPDRLLHNRSTPGNPNFTLCEGKRDFTTPKSFVLGRDSYKGMGLDFADVNGDGLFDMYISNIADDFALHEGHFVFVSTGDQHQFQDAIAPYQQKSSSLGLIRGGWGWDCRFVDFDNDGALEAIQATGFMKGTINRWPELHALGTTNDRLISSPKFWPKFQPPTADLSGHNINPFYVRSDYGRFVNIAEQLEMSEFWNTRGLAIADVDGDGWQDFVAANQWEPSVYFHNRSKLTSTENSFLAIHLILPQETSNSKALHYYEGHPNALRSGSPAIGATATIKLPDGRTLVSHVDGGSGHSGKRAPTIHFGLGNKPPPKIKVKFNWRDRSGQLHEESANLNPGKWYTIELSKRG